MRTDKSNTIKKLINKIDIKIGHNDLIKKYEQMRYMNKNFYFDADSLK